jgi:hypothetical protein
VLVASTLGRPARWPVLEAAAAREEAERDALLELARHRALELGQPVIGLGHHTIRGVLHRHDPEVCRSALHGREDLTDRGLGTQIGRLPETLLGRQVRE